MIRHIGIQFIEKPDSDQFGPVDVLYTDLDTGTKLGDGWVKLDKTWIISTQFLTDRADDGHATIVLACNSNADKSKCPIVVTDPFVLSRLNMVLVLTTSTETWSWFFIHRVLWDQLSAMGVTELMYLTRDDNDCVMAVECISNGKVINPIIKVRGLRVIDTIEEENAFTEIHTRTTIYKVDPENYARSIDGSSAYIPYILQKTNNGITALIDTVHSYKEYEPKFEE